MPPPSQDEVDGSHRPLGDDEFAALMAPLGPWPCSTAAAPVAIAVSGGADSVCLAILAASWAAGRAMPVLALIVDHRLRPDSTREAIETAERLRGHAIPARLLTLRDLQPGPGLAERARVARYGALLHACREIGAVDLLLGHHAHDQAETILIRQRAQSGPDGLAGMAPLLERDAVRLVRPLLPITPGRLRATLRQRGTGWVEDPSNRDPRATRTSVRLELSDHPDLLQSLLDRGRQAGRDRQATRWQDAVELAGRVTLRAEGFAVLPPELVSPGAMASLVRTIGGQTHRPPGGAIERLLCARRPATLAGTRLLPAGRLGPGWLLVREAASVQPPIAAAPGACWDNRFLLRCRGTLPPGLQIGPLGAGSIALRQSSRLPAAVLSTLPCLRRSDGDLLAVPHLGWRHADLPDHVDFLFQPPLPATESTSFTIA